MTRIALPFVALSLGIVPACGKKPEPAPVADAAMAPEPDVAAAPAPDVAPMAEADAAAPAGDAAAALAGDAEAAAGDTVAPTEPTEWVRAVLLHAKVENPVTASFEKFEVVDSNIDLTNLATAKVVIEVDAASIVTGDAKRDGHVKSADFLEIDKFAKMTITIAGLKAVENTPDTYDATATIDMRGITKDVPVQFKVVEKMEGAIVIEGETKGLARADWGVGGEVEKVNVGPIFDAQVRLTLKNVTRAPKPE